MSGMRASTSLSRERLENLLKNLEQNVEIERNLREISRLRIPETVARSTGLLARIQPFAECGNNEKYVATIVRKNEKMIEANRIRRLKFAEKKEKMSTRKGFRGTLKMPPRPLHYQTTIHHTGCRAATIPAAMLQLPKIEVDPPRPLDFNNIPSAVMAPLTIEIPNNPLEQRFESNDLLVEVQPTDPLNLLAHWSRVHQVCGPFYALNFGPGLQRSPNSAFYETLRWMPQPPSRRLTRYEYLNLFRLMVADTPLAALAHDPSIEGLLAQMNHAGQHVPPPAIGALRVVTPPPQPFQH